ncbi:hypothetical protein ACFQZZ_32415 [Nocardia sp. GCM10030253]|uniref:hypothetical protein n=1 Tax=Nocardia sp. GCM10030253 TaxID=3273404 RepID=UPI0036422FD0
MPRFEASRNRLASLAHRLLGSSADEALDRAIAMRVEDTRITGLYFVGNPHKLTHFDSETHTPCDEHRPRTPLFEE